MPALNFSPLPVLCFPLPSLLVSGFSLRCPSLLFALPVFPVLSQNVQAFPTGVSGGAPWPPPPRWQRLFASMAWRAVRRAGSFGPGPTIRHHARNNKRARVSLTLRLICGYLLRALLPFLTCIYETLLDLEIFKIRVSSGIVCFLKSVSVDAVNFHQVNTVFSSQKNTYLPMAFAY